MKEQFKPCPYFPSLKDKRYVKWKLLNYVFYGFKLNRTQTIKLIKLLKADNIQLILK